MPPWRLAIAIATPPPTPLDAVRRFAVRERAAFAALGALILTLILGWSNPVAPQVGWMLGGLSGVLGLGLLAWHLARLTALPMADPLLAALAAGLIAAALLPALAPQAAFVPAILALWASLARPGQRVVALLVQCGALAWASAAPVNQIGLTFGAATMLGFAGFLIVSRGLGPANDNPSMERSLTNSSLMPARCYANNRANSESGSGE
jgi:hypothetical protein